MSERRRLKAGVEVEVDGDSVWLHVGPGAVIAFTLPKKYGGVDLITEPIPEEPTEPKVGDEVMPDAGGSLTDDDSAPDVAPPPGAEQDAPGGEEPPTLKSFWGVAPHATGGVSSVEFVRALRDEGGEGGDEPSVEDVLEWLEDIAGGWVATPGAKQPGAAARIIREQRAEIERLTERLTITPEKVKAAFAEQSNHPFRDHPAMLCSLTAAGMIDPEVGG